MTCWTLTYKVVCRRGKIEINLLLWSLPWNDGLYIIFITIVSRVIKMALWRHIYRNMTSRWSMDMLLGYPNIMWDPKGKLKTRLGLYVPGYFKPRIFPGFRHLVLWYKAYCCTVSPCLRAHQAYIVPPVTLFWVSEIWCVVYTYTRLKICVQ